MASGLIGYASSFSVRAGGQIGLKLSSASAQSCELTLQRVRGADWTKAGAVPRLETCAHPASGPYPCRHRPIPAGSYGLAPAPPGLANCRVLSLGAWVYPTAKPPRHAAILSLEGTGEGTGEGTAESRGAPLVLGLDDRGHPALRFGERLCAVLESPLPRAAWSILVCTLEGGTVTLSALLPGAREVTASGRLDAVPEIEQVRMAAVSRAGRITDFFDGRLESPALAQIGGTHLSRALQAGRAGLLRLGPDRLADWNFAKGIDSQRIHDDGPARCDGRLVNRPARAVTGAFWDGRHFDWPSAPDHYAAVHFHSDDLDDCDWPDDITLQIPPDWPPGLYAARVENTDGADLIPFAVRAAAVGVPPRLAVLLPTFTYLSYGNARNAMRGPDFGVRSYPDEETLAAHPALGRSQYDLHDDRSPSLFSSPRRPLLTMRFGIRPWGLPVDAALLGFLEHLDTPYDILTDGDLHGEGIAALQNYACVLTGNHPEYYSAEMLDALEAFTHRGGRLMYLGGNGFYWRISACPETGTIEVRRAEDGTRAWIAAPGEGYHAMDGRYGGLWRRLGRPPNRLVDVGFAAQGDFDVSGHYLLRDGVRESAAAFVLDGVEGPAFGTHGWLGGGAAGQEIDRADPALGTSSDTIVLASSTGHTPAMMRTIEEMLSTVPPFADPKVRADVTLRALPAGGAVFSVGSMTWIAALDHDEWDNDIARITDNVLRRFLDPAPLTLKGADD
ncbi:N,N-dimethylformamidase beta subunit family domain-containing protein [Algihabitans albus]|uniref:N,N-dimethylformamidase beta subunit family domain-containing protein n=1 Tax=Algihabitans albus TaxID=2164067 RepID=UPI000E5C9326|nr:N,N-dimethylformamidase beta subunit family domain-containing protein [Algihabitans albus]